MDYIVDRNIPIPTEPYHKNRFPFNNMSVGDSFVVAHQDRHSVSSAAWIYGNKTGRKFTTRKYLGGIRIWRTA
jgi:hypothetical protein